MSGTPAAPGELAELREVTAGLRAANARLRELLAAKDAQVGALTGQLEELLAAKDAQIGALTGQLEELRAQVADLAEQVRQNSANSSGPPSSDWPGTPAP